MVVAAAVCGGAGGRPAQAQTPETVSSTTQPAAGSDAAAGQIDTGRVAVDQATPVGALKVFSFAVQRGDRAALRQVLSAGGEVEGRMADAMIEFVAAEADLRRAIIDKFGAEQSANLIGESDEIGLALRALDDAEAREEGDTATVVTHINEPPLTLKKVDGRWVLPIGQLAEGLSDAARDQRSAELVLQTRVFSDLAHKIRSGSLNTLEQVAEALENMTAAAAAEGPEPTTLPAPE